MRARKHFFVSESDGGLYDTRVEGWSNRRALRPDYSKHFRDIETTAQLRATLRAGAYAWPGGYPLYFLTQCGEALSFESVRENIGEVIGAIQNDDSGGGWLVVACQVNEEDSQLTCAHSGKPIESAYGTDESEPLRNESGFPDQFGIGDNLGESPDY